MNTALCRTSRYIPLIRPRTINPRLNWSAPHVRFDKQTYKMASLASAADGLSVEPQALGLISVPKYPGCHPEVNVFDIYRAHLTSILVDVTGVDASIVYPALQWTNTPEKGDLLLAVPALRVKGKKPAELAAEWIAKFPESPLVHKPSINQTFVQFFFKVDKLANIVIPSILSQQKTFGQNKFLGLKDAENPSKGPKKIIVEFSSPNIAKPFHAGHLRSTIIGGFLANLYEGAGWDVVRINYLGDWGKQYGILAMGFEKYGNEEALVADPIKHLFEVYVKINKDKEAEEAEIKALKDAGKDYADLFAKSIDERARVYFKAMTDNEPAAIKQWSRFRELSIKRYKETYARLNIHFDVYSGESQVTQAQMDAASKTMIDMKISEESEGSLIVDFSKHVLGKPGKSLEKTVIQRKDGTALYLTRDISELLGRYEKYQFDHMIYVVASQQDLHLKQLFKIIELMGHEDIAKRCQHINFGIVQGMSTRKGTVIFLDDILKEAGEKMHEVMQTNETKYQQVENPLATADILGITGVMVQDLSGKRINNYLFDLQVMTAFEGDTGPYLQYAHARLCSIGRRAELTPEEILTADLSLLTEPHALELIRMLAQYPDVVQNTLKTLEPTTILGYLFKMTHSLSSSYSHLRIVGDDKKVAAGGPERELSKARMALYEAARVVLNNGMRLLGLTPVDRM